MKQPAVMWVDGDHFIAVLKVDRETATVHDPNKLEAEQIETDALLRRSGGILLKIAVKQ